MSDLDELARRYGIVLTREQPDGGLHRVPDQAKRQILAALGVDASSEESVAQELGRAEARSYDLRALPDQRCYVPEWLQGRGAWGISVQLYELRSGRDWGIGDFSDLEEFCRLAGRLGADFVGTNPLHALFLAEPERRSPFSPSNRLFLNPLYIAVDRVAGYSDGLVPADRLTALRQSALVDYPAVAALKLETLRTLFSAGAWMADEADFAAFRQEGGDGLRSHALFEALSLHMAASAKGAGWHGWPEHYRDHRSAAVAAFAEEHAEDVAFQVWLQWLARRQLRAATRAAAGAGMRIGLYLDLAVGDAPDGSATWSDPGLYAIGMSIGAPPDFFSAKGQDWNLAPLSPTELAQRGHEPYRRLMGAAMADAGALRIDHAMALYQLFWLPSGGTPAEGAHVRYRLEEMLRALAESSRRNRALVIGEDLGFVPSGFREMMEEMAMLCYRPLYFQETEHGFLPADGYPRLALTCLSTHDLPTLKGWWRGSDIAMRQEHGLIDADAAEHQFRDRATKRGALIELLRGDGLLEPGFTGAEELDDADFERLSVAAHRLIARTPSLLVAVRLADLTGESDPTNVPGTVDAYPNWQLKSSIPLEELESSHLLKAVAAALLAERPRQP